MANDMSDFNKGEIGVTLRVDAGQDISSASPVLIIAEPEIGTAKEFTATVPAVDVTVNGITFTANEYAEFKTTTEDDLDYVGRWRNKIKATFSSTNILQTNYVKFRVLP